MSGQPDAYGRGVVTDEAPRCWRCNRLLAVRVSRPWEIRCSRCKADNKSES
jgi:phage FluMu protein Com